MGTMKATIHTTEGDIALELYPDSAPMTVRNFAQLAKGEREWMNPVTGMKSNDPLYDGVIFHRVIDGFMIQTGDPIGNGTGGPGYQFDDEIDPALTFEQPYVLAMANAGTRMGHGTNGSQFFITVAPTTWLQGKHTIFGRVTDDESKKVVDRIATTPTGPQERPIDEIAILHIDIED